MDTNDDINKEGEAAAKNMEGQDLADPGKPGLMEQMNNLEFNDDGGVVKKEPKAKTETPEVTEAADSLGSEDEVKKATESSSKTEEDVSTDSEADEPKEEQKESPELEINEEFFGEEETDEVKEKSVPEGSFDESKFDEETAAVLKALEEKGHPGDVYKKVREELKEARQATMTPEQEKEMAELKLKAEEVDGLRARLDDLSNQSAQMRVENSDQYIREVIKPAENIFKKAEELAAQYEGDPEVIKNIIRERDRRTQNEMVTEQLKDMSDFDRNEVFRMVQDFGKLIDKREDMMQDAEKSIEAIEAKRIQEEEASRAEQRKNVQTMLKDMWGKYEDKIPGLLDESGNQSSELKQLMSKSLSIDFAKAKGRDQAYASFAGVVLPYLVKQMNSQAAELAEYKASDAKSVKKSATPGKTVTPAAKSADKEPEGLLARMANVDLV